VVFNLIAISAVGVFAATCIAISIYMCWKHLWCVQARGDNFSEDESLYRYGIHRLNAGHSSRIYSTPMACVACDGCDDE
jgi:hypothetical protein